MPTRRLVNVLVTPDIIAGLCFPSFPGSWTRTDRGLPIGAKCVSYGFDSIRDRFWFTFEHESFDEVSPGAPTPTFDAIELSVVHFVSPIEVSQVAMIERLTAEQVARAESPLDDTQPTVVGG